MVNNIDVMYSMEMVFFFFFFKKLGALGNEWK